MAHATNHHCSGFSAENVNRSWEAAASSGVWDAGIATKSRMIQLPIGVTAANAKQKAVNVLEAGRLSMTPNVEVTGLARLFAQGPCGPQG
jgi:hypothetical protein